MYDTRVLLPFDIWYTIFKYIDLKTLSTMCIVNKTFNEYIQYNKWKIIDGLKSIGYYVPMNQFTYSNYYYCIDWNSIIFYGLNIPDCVIEDILSFEHINLLFSYRRLSEHIIRKFFNLVNWRNLLFNQILPDDLLDNLVSANHLYTSDWKMLWKFQKNINESFISKYYDEIDWNSFSTNKNLSLDLIDKYKHKIVWSELTKTGLHEYMLLKYIEKFDSLSWINISWYSKLSPFFIRTFIKFLDKHVIIHTQKVPEDILKYILETCNDDDIKEYMNIVSKYQPLSYKFIKKYKHLLNLNTMIGNKYIYKLDLQKIYG